MTPDRLFPSELHTAALSIRDRVELVAQQVAHGADPDPTALAALMASAVDLHREIADSLFHELLDVADDAVREFSDTLEVVAETLALIARTVDVAMLVARFRSMARLPEDPWGMPVPFTPPLDRGER
ncbi:hypothetical protein AB0L40_09145 [Patulibacter sp. NPDC049589]|uniref:hypothetical protein n=1 Tax=Patulibacter sp. NPDC049589 TaxID=3154731 RepID=UPI0034451351